MAIGTDCAEEKSARFMLSIKRWGCRLHCTGACQILTDLNNFCTVQTSVVASNRTYKYEYKYKTSCEYFTMNITTRTRRVDKNVVADNWVSYRKAINQSRNQTNLLVDYTSRILAETTACHSYGQFSLQNVRITLSISIKFSLYFFIYSIHLHCLLLFSVNIIVYRPKQFSECLHQHRQRPTDNTSSTSRFTENVISKQWQIADIFSKKLLW